jgi:uncharacterized RDD family membrane protein YckC
VAIEFRCSQCGKLLRTGDDTAGKQAKCPSCGAILPVPELMQTAAAPPAPSPPRGGLPNNPFAAESPFSASPFGAAPASPFAPASDNPYQSPSSFSPPMVGWDNSELAGRGARFAGIILDGLINFGAMIPGLVLLVATGAFADNNPPDAELFLGLALLAVSVLAVNIFQWVLISNSGQSLGKKALGTRIVRLEDGKPPGFVKGVILRAWVPGLLGGLPCGIGPIFSLVNACWIFGEERRCLHDLIANTRVVVAR